MIRTFLLLFIASLLWTCKSNGSLPTDQDFQLLELNNKPVPTSVKASLTFKTANKNFSGSNGCNNYFGTYETDGAMLKFGPAGATKKYCADRAAFEQEFMQMLAGVDNYKYSGGLLQLQAGEQVLAVFK